jgi:hypothetical protein
VKVTGHYDRQGYALVEELIPPEVAQAFVAQLKSDLGDAALPVGRFGQMHNLLSRPAIELYSQRYTPMAFFLWGLTPIMREITGRDLLPTYDYLRIYREGDICKVHYDRPSCEHSLSLTLDYSDGAAWPLEVGSEHSEPSSRVEPDFGAEPFASLSMKVGDAVLYRGVHHRHARMQPNPNAWSVHLFLHWVDRNGPYAEFAFDQKAPEKVTFQFA